MVSGLLAGLLWGLDTVILGVALVMTPFFSTEQAIFLAPFVSTFLHDISSSIWMLIYMGIKKEYSKIIRALKTRSGKFIILAALLGGPIGMTGYVLAINNIGPSYTAIISSMFPAVGALLSFIFLKEKMRWYQILGLLVSIGGVIALSYSPGGEVTNLGIGLVGALMCVFGWSIEAVICAYGLRDPNISDEQALQIRQLTSALFYAIILLPILSGWPFTVEIAGSLKDLSFSASSIFGNPMLVIIISALFGTASYVFYYKAIVKIGASKSMALNITYSAWAILFSFMLLKTTPSVMSIICALIVMAGSIVASTKDLYPNK
ncbi:MAG: DMT family transporter [Spirochaetaceae bacterium]|jgi:drug/metabolite transporter (DMT)-like permease|nr:DMT family transporter [Spirochaetaceae bacterium]